MTIKQTCFMFIPAAHFPADTYWTPGKSPMSKSSPHSSDPTCQTDRSPSRSATMASTAPSSGPRWVVHSYYRAFPCYSIIQLTYIYYIFCFIPIVSYHKCVTWCIPSFVPKFPILIQAHTQGNKGYSSSLKTDISENFPPKNRVLLDTWR